MPLTSNKPKKAPPYLKHPLVAASRMPPSQSANEAASTCRLPPSPSSYPYHCPQYKGQPVYRMERPSSAKK